MKKLYSVFSAAVRCSFGKKLAVFALSLAVQTALLLIFSDLVTNVTATAADNGRVITYTGIEQLFAESHIKLVFALAFIALAALLAFQHAGGSRMDYTLSRLSVTPVQWFIVTAAHNAFAFALLWLSELLLMGAAAFIAVSKMPPEAVSGQTVVLAFWRDGFLHSLMPMNDIYRHVQNIVMLLSMGICTAGFAGARRAGKTAIGPIVLAAATVIFFKVGFEKSMLCALYVVIALVCDWAAIVGVFGGETDEKPENTL